MGSSFVSYTVDGDRVTGFRTVDAESGFEAVGSAPATFQFPTFSDPTGTRLIIRLESGPFAGVYVSPDDPGVSYRPGV